MRIERGHFLCSSIDGCEILVRFDDKQPERYDAVGPSDHSTTALFIQGYESFLTSLHKARRVRIQAQFYREGHRVFTFNVRGLEWERPALEPAPREPEAEVPHSHTSACIDEGMKRGLVMDALTAFIRQCSRDGEQDSAELTAAEKHCAGLTDADYAKTACETKFAYCEQNHRGQPEHLACMARP